MSPPDLICPCGFTSYSQLIFDDHRCLATPPSSYATRDPSQKSFPVAVEEKLLTPRTTQRSPSQRVEETPSRRVSFERGWSKESRDVKPALPPPPPPPQTALSNDSRVTAKSSSPRAPKIEAATYDVDSSALFKCICGFSAFSQLIFEDHSCSFSTPEMIKAATDATSASRLQDAGLSSQHYRYMDSTRWFKDAPTVLIKDIFDKMIWGPRPLTRESTAESLAELVLQEIGKAEASSTLTFLYQDECLAPEENLFQLLPNREVATLTAVVREVNLELHCKCGFFGQSPDVTTEIDISLASEQDFEVEVKAAIATLRDVCGSYTNGCNCATGQIREEDTAKFLPMLDEKARGMSCVSYGDCLGKERPIVENFLVRAGPARYWKHDAYGGGQLLLMYASGHLIRFSVMAEEGQLMSSLTMDYKALQELKPLSLSDWRGLERTPFSRAAGL